MRTQKLLQWAAVLALAVAPSAGGTAAAADATLTLTGTMNELVASGAVGADLAQVAANGGVHTWTLTLHGVTHSREVFTNSKYALYMRSTFVHATSFELSFDGPGAAILNEDIVRQFVGGSLANGAYLSVSNAVTQTSGAGWALWSLGLRSGDDGLRFTAGAGEELYYHFAVDADGFPLVPSELPVQGIGFEDRRSGTYGAVRSDWGGELVEIAGDVGPPQTPALNVSDASVTEGDRGSAKLNFRVTLSNMSTQTISVGWRTVAGTATAKLDFGAASGTVSFAPGETSKTVTVSVKSDRTSEPDETLSVELYNAAGAPIVDGVGVGTIRNDD
jgi:hypothetical protein